MIFRDITENDLEYQGSQYPRTDMFNMDSFDMESLNRQFFESAAFSEFQAGVVLEPVSGEDSSPTHHDQENTVS